jgi:ABC-type amino acid transport substrate-binding protein
MYIDLLHKMLDEWGGVSLDLQRIEFAGVLPGLKAGRFDMGAGGVRRTAARLASPDFALSDPYLADGVGLLVRKDSPIQTWDDARGKALGGVRGENELESAKARLQATNVVEFPGRPESVLAVSNGQVDVVAGSGAELVYVIKTAPNGADLRVVPELIDLTSQGTALRKENQNLLTAVNCLVHKYMADGSMQQLAVKWYGSSAPVDNVAKAP